MIAMQEARISRARRALAAFAKDDVRPFVDVDRLVRSELFAEIVDMATEHASTVGDLGYLNTLLGLLADTQYEEALLIWVSARLPVSSVVRGGQPSLRNGTHTVGVAKPLGQAFPSAVAAQKAKLQNERDEARIRSGKLRTVEVRSDDYLDMLDSKARLPGSFGSGRRG